MLTREQILGAADLLREEVSVPEWGGHVYVRVITAAQKEQWEQWIYEKRGDDKALNLVHIRAKLLSYALVDDGGNRVFADADTEALSGKSSVVLDRLFLVAKRLNRIGADEVETLAKNS